MDTPSTKSRGYPPVGAVLEVISHCEDCHNPIYEIRAEHPSGTSWYGQHSASCKNVPSYSEWQ